MKRPTTKEYIDCEIGQARVNLLRQHGMAKKTSGRNKLAEPEEKTADVVTPLGSSVQWAEPDDPIYRDGWTVSPGELNIVSGFDSRPKKMR